MSRREDTQRRKVAKKLQEEISKCTDPKILVKLTQQYNDLKPKPIGRPRNQQETANPIANTGKLPRRKTGSAVDELSDEDYRIHLVVERTEAIKRKLKVSSKEALRQAVSELSAEGMINAEEFRETG